jgi:hypothetical protein
VSSWQPNDPPLPSLFVVLAEIFQQIDIDEQTLLYVPYFQQVVEAHDENRPIPPIPADVYPQLNHIVTPIPSNVVARKRKAVPDKVSRKGKRQKTLSLDSNDDEGGQMDDVKENEEEGKDEESETELVGQGTIENVEEESMNVDGDGEYRPGRGVLSATPAQGSSASRLPTSIKPKLPSIPIVEIIARKPREGKHPAEGLTLEQLKASWRDQAGREALTRRASPSTGLPAFLSPS